jgi:ABC-type multidrug transport system fused ATPase/permease subunit
VRSLPLADPGTADHRSPGRYLWWLARGQWHTLALGMCFGIIWMSSQAVMPAVIGRAIDRGIADKDTGELLKWSAILFAIGLVQAVSGIMRHRFAVTNWLTAAYRTVQLVGRQVARLGGTLPRRVSTGEVVAIGTTDISSIGQVMDVTARFAGAVVSFFLVSVILLQTSVTLGLVVLIGVPVLMLLIGPLLAPLQRRSARQRHLTGELSTPPPTSSPACGYCAGSAASRCSSTATAASPSRPAGPVWPSPGCSPCSRPCRCSCPVSSWWSWSGSARGTPCRDGSALASWSRSTATPRS